MSVVVDSDHHKAPLVRALDGVAASVSLKQVPRVLALLPPLARDDAAQLATPAAAALRSALEAQAASALLQARHQASLLLCAQLALSSLRHAKKLVPPLLRCVAVLPLGDTRQIHSIQATQERFLEALIRTLLDAAAKFAGVQRAVCDAVVRLVDALVVDVERNVAACFGALRGIALHASSSSPSSPPNSAVAWDARQCAALIGAANAFAGAKLEHADRVAVSFQAQAAVLRAAGSGAVAPDVVQQRVLGRALTQCGSSQLYHSAAYGAALRLAVACVAVDVSAAGDVHELLARQLLVLTQHAAAKDSDVFERNAVALVHAVAPFCPLLPAAKAPRKVAALIGSLIDGLLTPALSSRVRNECGAALVEVLAACPTHAEKTVRNIVDEFFVQHDKYREALRSNEQQRVACEELISPLVATLGHIAKRLDDPALTRAMVQPLISRVELSFLPVDVLLLEHLMHLATLGHEDSHNEIVDLVVAVFIDIVDSKPPKKMPNTIANAFVTLAKKLPGATRRDRLLRRLLRLHQLLMQNVPKAATDALAAASVHLSASGRLLVPIAELLPDVRAVGALRDYCARVASDAGAHEDDAVQRSVDELAHLLRSMWFALTLWSQVRDTGGAAAPSNANDDNSRFADSWLPAVTSIACHMPSLAPGSQRVWVGIQAELSTCLKHGFQKREATVRSTLQTLLPLQAAALRTVAPELCAYVLAVHTLELRRIGRSLTASAALQYVADDALEAAQLVAPLRAVADELANTFRNFMKQLGATPAREHALADAVQALLIGFCHSSEAVRTASAQHVDDLTRLYPHVLWNRECLTTLLDLLDVVGASVVSDNFVSFSVLPNSANGVDLPEDAAGKRALLTSMVKLATKWLTDALHRAPGETQALLHQYMHNFRRHSAAFLHHVGCSLAVDIATRAQIGLSSKAAAALPGDRPPCTVDNGANFVNALELKALYTGEIDGMMKLLQQFSDDAGADARDAADAESEQASGGADDASEAVVPAGAADESDDDDDGAVSELESIRALLPVTVERDVVMRRMAMVLLAKYRTYAAKFSDGGFASEAEVKAFGATLYRTAAFLIAQRTPSELTRDLLHVLAWAPVLPFTRSSVRSGVFAWGWLMAARPDHSLALLSEMHDAWCWVIAQRRGLFAADEPLRAVNMLGEPQRGAAGDAVPVGKRRSDDEADADNDEVRAHAQADAAAGGAAPAFRDVEPHRIWLAFLDERHTVWFQSSATHVATLRRMADRAVADPALLTTSPSSLASRCLLLRWCARFADEGAFTVTLLSLLRRERIYRAALSWFAGRPMWRVVESRAEAELALSTMVQFAEVLDRDHLFEGLSSSSSTTAAVAARRAQQALPADVAVESVEQLSDMRNLIVLLLGHEMERAVAWNNPLSRPEKAFTKDVALFTVRHRRATARDWRAFVRAAWRASVSVAMRLGDRFRHNALVREALAARIAQSGVGKLAADGDAVTAALQAVLEHGSARKEDVVEQALMTLSRWAPTSPTAALRLLRSDLRNDARVIDYALRSLRSCSVRAVIFLIPQLVQVLRYDRTGLVEQFLRVAGRASELVAHQIIWNSRIYTTKDEAGNADAELAPVAQRLSDALVAQFSAEQAHTYHLVSDFFENFTNASALLIELKHKIEADEPGLAKDEIRARLTKRLFVELQKTPVEQVVGVAYLPTNPDWMVHDIVPAKSTALQSAAKVPLLVSFTVSDRQRLPSTAAVALIEDDDDDEDERRPSSGIARLSEAVSLSMFDAPSDDEDEDEEEDEDEDEEEEDEVEDDPDVKKSPRDAERDEINRILGQTVSRRIREADRNSVEMKQLKKQKKKKQQQQQQKPQKKVEETQLALAVPPGGDRLARMRRLLEQQPRNKRVQASIFKAGDDIRQDMLALQIIELFKTILDDVGLDVYLYPYKAIATRPGCGIIEVVPNAKSRDAIGKYLDGNLIDYFVSKYGPVSSEPFQRARTNLIRSMAGYAVVSYILQVKDRHNGNILIDDEGHLVHIDFGFIFDISPGGDIGFEVSPFKLSQEMIDVMGGEPGAEQFTYFMEQGVRAFMACRTHMESIVTLVELMLDTKLPCFKPGCIQRLRERFFPDKSEADAALAMSAVMLKAFSLVPFYAGHLYDVFQSVSQGISF